MDSRDEISPVAIFLHPFNPPMELPKGANYDLEEGFGGFNLGAAKARFLQSMIELTGYKPTADEKIRFNRW